MLAYPFGASARQSHSEYGHLTIKIGSEEPREYSIIAALLYKKASVEIDTTAEVFDRSGSDIYYYPRLNDGQSNVLQLVLQYRGNGKPGRIDMLINLGDSLRAEMVFEGESGVIFLNPANRFFGKPLYSRKMTGRMKLRESGGGKEVSGEMDLSCVTPFFRGDFASFVPVQINGEFSAPAGQFRETSLSTVAPRKAISRRYRRNLAIAVVLTLGIIIALGAR